MVEKLANNLSTLTQINIFVLIFRLVFLNFYLFPILGSLISEENNQIINFSLTTIITVIFLIIINKLVKIKKRKDELDSIAHELAVELEWHITSQNIDQQTLEKGTNYSINEKDVLVEAKSASKRARKPITIFLFKGEKSIISVLFFNIVLFTNTIVLTYLRF